MVTCSAFPFHNSGVAYVIHNTAKGLIKKGHEVFVLTLVLNSLQSKEDFIDTTYSGYKVRGIIADDLHYNLSSSICKKDYNNPNIENRIEEYLDQIKPDIVHFHSIQKIGANTVRRAKEKGYKTVVTMHDWWWLCPFSFMTDCNFISCNQLAINTKTCEKCIQCDKAAPTDFIEKRTRYLKEILEKYTDLIIPVSNYLKSYLQPNGISRNHVVTVPNGVEPCPHKSTSHSKIRFAFLGGKHEAKGYDLLVEACKQLCASNYEVHVYGNIKWNKGLLQKAIGYIQRGSIKELFAKAKRHMKKDNSGEIPIRYHPLFQPEEKDRVYEKIDVLLSLSKVKESSSLVVREALIRGIPVITTPSGGPQEVIQHDKNGLVLEDISSCTLKKAMEHVLQTDALSRWMEYMEQNPYQYTYEDQVEKLVLLYEDCLYQE